MEKKEIINDIIKEMLAKAKAMYELSESPLCLDDTRLDIVYMQEHPTYNEYIWMLRTYGTHLISLDKEGVYQSDIDTIKGFNYNQKILYHITAYGMVRITEKDAIKYVQEKLPI